MRCRWGEGGGPLRASSAEAGGASPGERGSVTAEFAMAMPAVVLVLALALTGLQLAGQQVRLQDAAALAARALARGDPATDLVERLAPGASLSRSSPDDLVCVRLGQRAGGAPGALLQLRLTASACSLDGGR